MLEAFLEASADGQGLSRVQIIFAVAYMLTLLSLLIVFVLITLSAWNSDSSFTAMVQSALVSGCGKASAAMRTRVAAEDSDSVDGLVGKIMSEQDSKVTDE